MGPMNADAGPGSTTTPPEPGTGTVCISPVEDFWYAIWDYSEDGVPDSYRVLAGPEGMTREQAIAWARAHPAERIFIHDGEDWAPL
jgi:hypothetical protein